MTSFFSQFTPDQMRTQYRRNADQLRGMLAVAERKGKAVNGFTADVLRERVAEYDALACASDDVIRQHTSGGK